MFKLANKLGQTKPRYRLACFNKKTPKPHITWAFFPKEETKAKYGRALADVPTTPGPPAPRPRSWLRLGLGAAHSPCGRSRGGRPSQRLSTRLPSLPPQATPALEFSAGRAPGEGGPAPGSTQPPAALQALTSAAARAATTPPTTGPTRRKARRPGSGGGARSGYDRGRDFGSGDWGGRPGRGRGAGRSAYPQPCGDGRRHCSSLPPPHLKGGLDHPV